MDSVNILIPVFNEGKSIERTVREIRRQVRSPHTINVVYDFEEDDTIPVVNHLNGEGLGIRCIRNHDGLDVCSALKTGFRHLDGLILVVMADGSDSLDGVDAMISRAGEGFDVVCGSRYMRGGKQIGGPLLKKLLSRFAGLSLHALCRVPTHDVTNSFKLYKKGLLERIVLESTEGFEIGMEIVVKAHAAGFRITEVPCVWKDRTEGVSRFKLWKWLPRYLHWYFYAFRNSFFLHRTRTR